MNERTIAQCKLVTCFHVSMCCLCALCGAGDGDSDGRLSAAEVGDVVMWPGGRRLHTSYRYITFANCMCTHRQLSPFMSDSIHM